MADWVGGGELVIYVAYALVGVATYLIARMLLQEQETRAAAESLDENQTRSSDVLVRLTKPVFRQYIVPSVRGKAFWDQQRRNYRRKLISSGLKDELTPDEFIAFKIFLIAFFPLVCGFLNINGFDLEWYYVVGSGVVGWFYPDLWVRTRIEARQKEIRKSLPFIVDLLALSTEAGLDFIGAIQKVVEKANPSPLVEEFDQLLKEMKVGASRADALREMGQRIDMPEVNSFVSILISADQMGASIGKVLRQQSEQIRSTRFVLAEKAGAAAGQKLVLPIVLIVFPAVLIMIAGPFVLSFIYPSGN